VIVKNGEKEIRVSVLEFQKQTHFLLTKLKEKTNGTFSIPEIENFINSFDSHSLKAKSSVKSDIRIVIHDQRAGTNPELGFSIKSQLGGASTLLNAGKTTNFIFKINNLGLSQNQILEINEIETRSKIKDRIEKITELGGILEFQKPTIIAESLHLFFTSTFSSVIELTSKISIANPLEYNLETNHPFYSYKIKRFLTDIALGMMPSKVWTGELDATGGYLVVKENGEVLCYHIYNRNEFEDYLFVNTKLETASSTRHEFGKIYEENGQIYFKLNLQIRFK
jgi:hypothetical protein